MLNKAKESLQAAELCYAQKLYNATANRAYYAMFQAGIAALYAAGIQPTGEQWSHAGLQAAFTLELTRRRKPYPHTLSVSLKDGLSLRNTADYKPTDISERLANQTLRWAREFLQQVERQVNR
ncbi:MAG TPA: HEPN domain-containing protein [Anaerolineae bacterium]|nr:HEPN domain-containing protein [Anaerolineae bacterium]HQI85955.1 HEPN domain-containing protein [Anaerolineae bacterium]